MRYVSTRGRAAELGFCDALLAGLATDGGLYVPETLPKFTKEEIASWAGLSYQELAFNVMKPFVAGAVSDEDFKKNEEIYKFLTVEANKRGIWVIQMFYNIIVSKPFAEHYNIKTQDRSRPITPLLSDYTRKSIGAFIEKYPNVGLLVCLGEAINTIDDDVEFVGEFGL